MKTVKGNNSYASEVLYVFMWQHCLLSDVTGGQRNCKVWEKLGCENKFTSTCGNLSWHLLLQYWAERRCVIYGWQDSWMLYSVGNSLSNFEVDNMYHIVNILTVLMALVMTRLFEYHLYIIDRSYDDQELTPADFSVIIGGLPQAEDQSMQDNPLIALDQEISADFASTEKSWVAHNGDHTSYTLTQCNMIFRKGEYNRVLTQLAAVRDQYEQLLYCQHCLTDFREDTTWCFGLFGSKPQDVVMIDTLKTQILALIARRNELEVKIKFHNINEDFTGMAVVSFGYEEAKTQFLQQYSPAGLIYDYTGYCGTPERPLLIKIGPETYGDLWVEDVPEPNNILWPNYLTKETIAYREFIAVAIALVALTVFGGIFFTVNIWSNNKNSKETGILWQWGSLQLKENETVGFLIYFLSWLIGKLALNLVQYIGYLEHTQEQLSYSRYAFMLQFMIVSLVPSITAAFTNNLAGKTGIYQKILKYFITTIWFGPLMRYMDCGSIIDFGKYFGYWRKQYAQWRLGCQLEDIDEYGTRTRKVEVPKDIHVNQTEANQIFEMGSYNFGTDLAAYSRSLALTFFFLPYLPVRFPSIKNVGDCNLEYHSKCDKLLHVHLDSFPKVQRQNPAVKIHQDLLYQTGGIVYLGLHLGLALNGISYQLGDYG